MNKNPLHEITQKIAGHIRRPMSIDEIKTELETSEYSAELIMQHSLLFIDSMATKLGDAAHVHAMMMRKEIAWDHAKLRHLLGDDDLYDMVLRCEGWFSTFSEGRKMQLECQRVLSNHSNCSQKATCEKID
jgi:hypothetical protein